MKKELTYKQKKCLLIIIILLEVMGLSFLVKNNSVYETQDKITNSVDKKLLSMYVEQTVDGKDYKEVDDKSFQFDDYKINLSMSKCVDNNGTEIKDILTVNNDGTVSVTSNKTVYCTLYFDINVSPLIKDAINDAKPAGLADHVAGGMYRFQGIHGEVNNYICIGKDSCEEKDDEMYRIIGVSEDGKVKVIKNTPLQNTYKWHTSSSNISWHTSNLFNQLNGTEFYDVLSAKVKYNIENAEWKDGGNTAVNLSGVEIYEKEQALSNTFSANIGLMYMSDYSLAANDEIICSIEENFETCKNGWIHLNHVEDTTTSEQTMAWYGYYSSKSYYASRVINSSGSNNYIGNISSLSGKVRPVFYLKKSSRVSKGNGAIDNPFILSLDELVTIDSVIMKEINGNTVTVEVNADENAVTYCYKLETEDSYTCTNSNTHSFELEKNKKYNLEVYVKNKIGFQSEIVSLTINLPTAEVLGITKICDMETSVTIVINGISSIWPSYPYEEVKKYYLKIDDGEYQSSSTNEFAFDGLEKGSTHTITAKVEDENGMSLERTYEITTKNSPEKFSPSRIREMDSNDITSELTGGLYRYKNDHYDGGYSNKKIYNNNVIFGTDKCTSNITNLTYKILGFTDDNKIKVLKGSAVGSSVWTYSYTSFVPFSKSRIYSDINGYQFLSSSKYFPNDTWRDKVAFMDWKYGITESVPYDADDMYNIENNFDDSVRAKIGLLYLHDIKFSSNWNDANDFIEQYFRGTNVGSREWTMTQTGKKDATETYYTAYALSYGYGSIYKYEYKKNLYLRPVFFLNNDIQLSGTGALDDPYIVYP